MKQIFDDVSALSSKITTKRYSTSFSRGIRFLHKKYREPIYAIYGFVRFADEIVDTFHEYDKKFLLDRFKEDTYYALDHGISTNPILNSFQRAVRKYNIKRSHIDTFLKSMEMDLEGKVYDLESYKEYILGSAEVVGLMCLHVFTDGNKEKYDECEYYAMRLGSAFQKINFLRDINADFKTLGRTYFPNVDIENFSEADKADIEKDIEKDFSDGYKGIKMLPRQSRFGVYIAYRYYMKLFKKIRKTHHTKILNRRIRIPNNVKFLLFLRSYVRHKINVI